MLILLLIASTLLLSLMMILINWYNRYRIKQTGRNKRDDTSLDDLEVGLRDLINQTN